MINGSVINGGPINGPGVIANKVKEVVKASSDIPISARKEFEEYIDTLQDDALQSIESVLEWLEQASDSDLPYQVVQNLDQIIQAIQTLPY